MKLLIKVSLITMLGLPLFSSAGLLTQDETTTVKQQQSQTTLHEANKLFVEGSSTFDVGLIRQAKDKYSSWLNESNTANHYELAEVLRSRASVSITLGDISDAISDYKKSNQFNPIGEIQLGICFLEKKQGAKPADIQACYTEAVQMFADKKVAKTDVNYLIARILSGDKTAIEEYKNIIQTEQDSDQLEIYKIAVEEYLDEVDCQQILTQCEKSKE